MCEICEKGFSQRGNLTKHLLSHENAHLRWNRETKEKPFQCPFPGCTKSFTAKCSLQNHISSHSKIVMDITSSSNSTEKASPILTNIYQPTALASCLHSGCTQSFSSDDQLRQHIFDSTPGLAEEFNFLRDIALKFASKVCEWDSMPATEKVIL